MRNNRGDAALLWDMLSSAEAILEMTVGMEFDAFCADRRTRRAVERELEIIGEAARGISPELKAAAGHIPWQKIIRQRHKIAHDYAELQEEILWRVVRQHLPSLVEQLKALIPDPPAADGDA